jgi:hypothetical protein
LDELDFLHNQKRATESTNSDTKEGAQNYCDNDRLDLSAFEPRLSESILDINKMKSIKESYPEDYNNKLERNYEMMEEKITKLKKEVKSLK